MRDIIKAKVLVVRKVTSNKGKCTAGVDRIKWEPMP
ncbi:reverse transcriptase N-terminal domain-containing protein [Parabacteroides sp. ZJ-118]